VDVLEAIMTRRSVPGVLQDPPGREVIEKLLAAANTAPNHHLTQPWRFAVLKGEARETLGTVMEASLRERMTGEDPKRVEGQALAERIKLLRAPVVIVASVKREPESRVPPFEDMAATAAAVQNLLLAAHGLGLGAYWRSGYSVFDPAVKAHLGLGVEDEIIAFVYVGYPDPEAAPRPAGPRTSHEDKTVWLGWD
jgi:nitroreductase